MNWSLWRKQIAAVMRLDLKKNFFSKRGWWIYLLAVAPVLICGGHSIDVIRRGSTCDFGQDNVIFAAIFQFYYLRLGIFFGCVGIFVNLFRGEMLDKSLHYYFLTPMRREVLLIGKYFCGLLIAAVTFTAGVALTIAALYWHHSSRIIQEYMTHGPGTQHMLAYLGVTLLACLGYGSVFLAMGLIFRNPMIPALGVLVWEGLNVFLPAALKKLSVIYYLWSLCPVQVPVQGPLAAIAVTIYETPAIVSIPGLLLLTAVILVIAARRVRRMEIDYVAE